MINAEVVPFDAVEGSDPAQSEDKWPTLWTTLSDSTHKVYYFRSSSSPNVYWVDLGEINLTPGRQPKQVGAYTEGLSGDISGFFNTP